jgi:hypothetical protein
MAVGDSVIHIESVSTGGTMDICSTGSATWLIKNITWAAPVTVARASTSLAGIFHTETVAGGLLNSQFHVSKTTFIRVTNTSTAANVCGYDGIIWTV